MTHSGLLGHRYVLPRFCINCGEPYPWTGSKLQAAKDLALELNVLDDQDRAVLEKSINDMVKDTPTSHMAAIRFKKIMLKVGQNAALMFREILINVLSETAKKTLWP